MDMNSMKTFAMKQAAKIIINVVKNSSEDNMARLFGTLKKFTKEPSYSGLEKMERLAREKDPVIEGFKKTFQRMGKVPLKKLVNNLIFNEFVIGANKRQAASEEYQTVIPALMVISPTYACNLHCVGCYAGVYGNKYHLSKEEVEDIIKQANELGMYFFVISGGEPFFWPHLLDILEEFNDSYFLIYSNGTFIDKDMAKRLAELGNATPALSVEGFEKETDWRRGKGVYKKVTQAWEYMAEEGLIYGASITSTRLNHETLMKDEFWDMLESYGVGYAWVFQYIPIGLGPDMKLAPTPQQRLERFRKVEEVRLSGRFSTVADFWNHGMLVNGCMAGGAKYLHINAKGMAEPCVFQHFAVDSIREKRLIEILKSPYFEAIKKMVPYDNNLLRPCMIIDHPQILRNINKKFGAKPTHEGAENITTKLAPELDKMAAEWKRLSDKVWYNEGYAEKYPVQHGWYSYETRKIRQKERDEKIKQKERV
ncbi:MAG: radical SAM protein [Thermotoga sp.]|nr:MAG: radical SAM protein [Thermotoga sp.]